MKIIKSNTCAGDVMARGLQIPFVIEVTGEKDITNALEKFAIASINCFSDPTELLERLFPNGKRKEDTDEQI